MRIRNHHRHRRAFTLVETLIAFAFLAVATGISLEMHQSRLSFDRTAMQRLTDQLAIENIAEQLAAVGNSELTDTANRLGQESGADVSVDPFESGSTTGWHVEISMASKSGTVVHHLWRLDTDS